jgi:hypothetical protein
MGRFLGVRTLLAGLAATAALLVVVVPSSARVAATAKVKVGLAYTTYPKSGKDQVFSATAGGASRRKLGGGYVSSLSPNGAYVAAMNNSASGMVIYKSGGGTIHVPSQAKHSDIETSWSPNSTQVAVSWNGTSIKHPTSGVDIISLPSGKILRSVSFSGQVVGVSFAPTAPGRVAFVRTAASQAGGIGSLEVLTTSTGKTSTLVKNKRVGYPLWTRYGIVYDSITPRGKDSYPAFQLMLRRNGKTTQITHMKIPALDAGLTPIAASSSGTRIIADFGGEDNTNAYSVVLTSHAVHKITIKGATGEMSADGISADGTQLLINYGSFEQPTSKKSVIASVPFAGGKPKILVHGASSPAWRQS